MYLCIISLLACLTLVSPYSCITEIVFFNKVVPYKLCLGPVFLGTPSKDNQYKVWP